MKYFSMVLVMILASCSSFGTNVSPAIPGSPTNAVPSEPAAPVTPIPPNFGYVDPSRVISPRLLTEALAFYVTNANQIKNKDVLTIVDFTLHSGKSRFFIIDMKTGAVTAIHVAHGSGSDPKNTGYATKFSNVSGSLQSSLGYYLTAELGTSSKHGTIMRIDGLSSTNSHVRARAIIIHSASYVTETSKLEGMSWGCFAVPLDKISMVLSKLKGGSLMYAGLE